MNSLIVQFAPLLGILSILNLVGLVAVLVSSISRHNKSKGTSGDMPWIIGAIAIFILPKVLFVAVRGMPIPVYFLTPLLTLGFVIAYFVRTMAAGNAPPAHDQLQAAFGRQHGGAPIATPGNSPYGAPPPSFGPPPAYGAPAQPGGFGPAPTFAPPVGAQPPKNPLFVQPAYPLASRSIDEMMLFMDLHPCACGETNFERRSKLVMAGNDMVAHYLNPCARCGQPREFKFVVNDPIPRRPDGGMQFGIEPSKILDPGEFAAASDTLAKQIPGSLQGMSPQQKHQAIDTLDRAAAALDEAIKFIPQGADEVPAQMFRTPVGMYERDRLPGQFKRYRLEARVGAYRNMLAQWRAAG